MSVTIVFDTKEIEKVEKALKGFDEKTAEKIVKKASRKGGQILYSSVQQRTPVGKTGLLKNGLILHKERKKRGISGKAVYDVLPDPKKADQLFKKHIENPGVLGGKRDTAFYPTSIEYGFLARAKGGGLTFYSPKRSAYFTRKGQPVSGASYPRKKVDGIHYMQEGMEARAMTAEQKIIDSIWKDIEKEWSKK